jgi:hypothetical protein
MTLQKREKILVIAVGSLLAILILYWIWPSSAGSLADLNKSLDDLQQKVAAKTLQINQARRAQAHLEDWQRRALPANQATARSLYQNWLLKMADGVKLKNLNINPFDASSRRGVYAGLGFTITGQGTLDQLTQFLYEFYSAGHLHKIRTLNILPMKNSSDLELTIVIEALSLPGSKQTDKLSAEPAKRLKLDSMDEYKKIISGRNLFAVYAPKPPAVEKKPEIKQDPKLDVLQFSYLTAIIEADGVPEAWIFERTSGQTFKVHEGEQFTIGKVQGKMIRIGYNEIEIEIDGQVRTIGYGNSLKM